MNKKTIVIEGREYILDIDKAKELQIIAEKSRITTFKVGDVFRTYSGSMFVIVPFGYNHSGKYGIMGNGGLNFFSDAGFEGFTEGEMLKWLNTGTKTFVKNINDDFISLLEKH